MGMDFNYFKNLFSNILEKNESMNIEEEIIKDASGDEVDLTQNDLENSFNLRLKGRERFFVHKVKDALRRLDEGNFGICEECGEDIGLKRLLARPVATQCLKCKEGNEKEESNLPYTKRSHTLGRTFANG